MGRRDSNCTSLNKEECAMLLSYMILNPKVWIEMKLLGIIRRKHSNNFILV